MTKDPFDLVRLPVEDTEFDKILAYPKNHKKHSKEQVEKLQKSIMQLGLMDPIIVDKDGFIIAGHGRFLAITKMRKEDPERFKVVPVKWARHLSEPEAIAARIASNKLSSNDYDVDILQSELDTLSASDIDIDIPDVLLETKEIDMFSDDMGDLNFGAITEDLDKELSDQEEANEEAVADASADDVSISKILGYSKVPSKYVKTIDRFIAVVNSESEAEGIDALVTHMEKFLEE